MRLGKLIRLYTYEIKLLLYRILTTINQATFQSEVHTPGSLPDKSLMDSDDNVPPSFPVSPEDTMLTPPATREAIFSGYYMSYEYFQKLVFALCPRFADEMAKSNSPPQFIYFLWQYDGWRSALPSHHKAKTSQVKVIFPQPGEVGEGDPNYYKYFFATRFVAAPLGSRAEDYPDSNLENEADKARQDEFVTFVRERYNFEVDRFSLQFGCFKDHHPESNPTHAGL